MGFKTKIIELAKESVGKLGNVDMELAELKQNERTFSPEYYREQYSALMQKKDDIAHTAEKEAAILADAFKKRVHEMFTPKGEDITEDAALLNSGINLTAAELEELAKKYSSNLTMQRLIFDHAENKGVLLSMPRRTEGEQVQLADELVAYVRSCMQRPEYASIWFEDSYIFSLAEGVID